MRELIAPRVPRDRTADSPAPPAPVSLEGVSSVLAGLNPEQRRAVTHGDGPLLVVAGPGTGKTHVITRRIAWLIATKRARPSEILALTFTDKAADEMQARVDVLVPYGYVDTAIHTFHAFGDRLIREHVFELGLPREPLVLSRPEATAFVRERLFEFALNEFRPLGDPTRFIAALIALFNRAKDEDVSPTRYAEFAASLERAAAAARTDATDDEGCRHADALEHAARRQRELAAAYGRYQELLAASGRIDFGDQVALAVRLLREHRDVRARVQRRYRYVLVDEFQDTNRAQLELLELVCGPRPNLTAVGDDDQSIYTFRGAALDAVLGFETRFGGAKRVVLRRNYRSRAPVLDAAYRLIRHNDPCRLETQLGLDKRLRANRRGAGAVALEARAFRNLGDEADWVAQTIADRIARGAPPNEFAILARTNADTEPFVRSLNMRGIPWSAGGATGLYTRPEVRPLLSFLRAVANPHSTVDLYGVATAEPYRLGGEDLASLLEYGRRKRRSLWSVLCELESQPGIVRISDAARKIALRLLGDMRAALDAAHERPAGEVLYAHLKRTGRLASLTRATTPDAEERLADIARFFAVVRDQGNVLQDDRVPFVVEQLGTLIESGDDGGAPSGTDEAEGVSVLTVHKAKGLEFRVVFLVGLADGAFPSRGGRQSLALPEPLYRRAAIAEEAPFAEERRLCYVAMTRARDELFLSYAVDGRGRRARRPSPFLAEILDAPAPRIDAGSEALPTLEPAATVRPRRVSRRREPLSLSFSQLDDYVGCPLRYKLRHVVGLPVPAHHSLGYGSALHQAVAAFHVRQQKGVPMPVEELLEVFRLHWSGDGFISREHEEARFAAGQDVLRRFHAANGESAPPVAVEQEFAFQVDADRIRGRIDRVDETPDGVVITDYKSSDVRDVSRARQKARESLQLAIYALAHEARTGSPPAAVQLHFLDSGVIGRVPVDRARLAAAAQKIRDAATGIRAGAFAPAPDYVACGYCPFREICPSSAA